MAKEIRQTSLDLSNVRTHGRSYVGRVVSNKMNATVVVSWDRKIYVPKFERYMLKTSKVAAHKPDSISLKEGDMVKIKQCRPISKTKNFMVIENLEGADDSSGEVKEKTEKKTKGKAEKTTEKKAKSSSSKKKE